MLHEPNGSGVDRPVTEKLKTAGTVGQISNVGHCQHILDFSFWSEKEAVGTFETNRRVFLPVRISFCVLASRDCHPGSPKDMITRLLSSNYQLFTISLLFKKCHIIVWTSSICLKYSNCKPSSWTGCILQYCIGVAGTSRRFCAICWTLANLPTSLPPDDCLTQTAHPHFTRMAILYKFAYHQHMIK